MWRVVLVALLLLHLTESTDTMVWMCLERCGSNITADLAAIATHHQALTAVSYERFDLDLGGKIRNNNFTDVTADIHKLGLRAFPMITTVSHALIYDLLYFASDEFIANAVELAVTNNYDGFNIDWEPSHYMLPNTSADYAAFIKRLAEALDTVGKELQVCTALWNPYFWNYPQLAAASPAKLITMDTYSYNNEYPKWEARAEYLLNQTSQTQLGIGLMTDPNPNTAEELQQRLDFMQFHNLTSLSIWMMPLDERYWDALYIFKNLM